MKDSKFIDGISWIVGAALLVSVSWIFLGLTARAIKHLFCIGYGC